MRKFCLLTSLLLSLMRVSAASEEFFVDTTAQTYRPTSPLTLWYTLPATATASANKWMEYSLPIGNGQMGASIMGGIKSDEIQFNEKTLWSGASNIGTDYGSYQNFGSLFADYIGENPDVNNYRRTLNLDSALCRVAFSDGKIAKHSRLYFASYPAKCVVAVYRAEGKGKLLSLKFHLESGKPGVDAKTTYQADGGSFGGKLDVISYCAAFKLRTRGRKAVTQTVGDGIVVRNAEEIAVILYGATDFDPYAPTYISGTQELSRKVHYVVNKAASKGWKKLLKEHLDDYVPLFSRMSLKIDWSGNTMPTDKLVDTYDNGQGKSAKLLQQLYFAYGRYLEIASSRGIDLPSNLQGIWNNTSTPPWNSDIHTNINVQMNYWPAEPTNLGEMHMPLLNFIINMATNHAEWQKVARDAGQSRGWTLYTEINNMGGMGAFMHNYVIANAWLATHLWQHYRYTLDRDFLLRAFPAMWSAAEFWIERLVRAADGTYECPKEYSPEQGPSENATAHSQQLVSELFENVCKAAEVLGDECGVGRDSLNILRERLRNIDRGLAIETYDGKWGEDRIPAGAKILREWKYSPYSVGEPNHRHSSHLMCLYPFSQIKAGTDLFEAAVNSMKLRGDVSTGWSMGWKMNLWARAHDGNRALKVLSNALRHSKSYGVNQYAGGIYYNLYDSHAPFQIDGNFGACAGIAEMLLQSHTDTLQLLPALPDAWDKGEVAGMKTIGDFTVSLSWQGGKLRNAEIYSGKGSKLYIGYPGVKSAQIRVNGKKTSPRSLGANTVFVPSKQGDKVSLSF